MEPEEKPSPTNSDDKFEYYVERSKKIRDLWRGILGGFGYVILALFLFILLAKIVSPWWFLIIIVLLYIGVILYFFYKKRKFLAIGLIFVVTVPPAVIGGCLYLTS
jgi:hypothetical protein